MDEGNKRWKREHPVEDLVVERKTHLHVFYYARRNLNMNDMPIAMRLIVGNRDPTVEFGSGKPARRYSLRNRDRVSYIEPEEEIVVEEEQQTE